MSSKQSRWAEDLRWKADVPACWSRAHSSHPTSFQPVPLIRSFHILSGGLTGSPFTPLLPTSHTALWHGSWDLYQPAWNPSEFLFFLFLFFLKVYFLRKRETEHEQGKGRERGRHRIQSRLQALSCQHRTWCGAWPHELWDHHLSWSRMLNRLSHPGAPPNEFLNLSKPQLHQGWQ